MAAPTIADQPEQQRRDEINRTFAALDTSSRARVLSAMGHPNYGEKVAEAILAEWVRTGRDLHDIVYGR